MAKSSLWLLVVGVVGGLLSVFVLVFVPVLVLTSASANAGACGGGAAMPPGGSSGTEVVGSPTILGDSVLSSSQLEQWWATSSYSGLVGVGTDAAPVGDVIALYLEAGVREGVRGDWAFAQAVLETGGFTNSDVRLRNNFAGIGHYDNQAAGFGFATVQTGVIAHIQLLKRFAAGNDVEMVLGDVGPRAGATATTWSALAGTWATDPRYWSSLSALYESMGGEAIDCEGSLSPGELGSPVSPDEVVEVPGVGQMHHSVAPNAAAMIQAAANDGVVLSGSGYRSTARQIELRQAHCGNSYEAIYEVPASSCDPPTARPGSSQHEAGLAIDFNNCGAGSAAFRWLQANAARFGFFNLPSESWHWSTTGA